MHHCTLYVPYSLSVFVFLFYMLHRCAMSVSFMDTGALQIFIIIIIKYRISCCKLLTNLKDL